MGFSFLNKPKRGLEEESEEEKLFDYRETEEYKTFFNNLGKRFEIYYRQLDRDVSKKIGSLLGELKNKIVELSFPPKEFNQYKINFNPDKHIVFGKLTLPMMKIVLKKDIIYDLYDEELEDNELNKQMKERWEKVYSFIEEIVNPILEEIFRDKEYHFKFGKKEKITGAKKYHLWTTSVSFSFEVPVPPDYDPKKVVQVEDETKGTEEMIKKEFMSIEEKKLVMNKTIYTSSDPSDETVKVDHLDKNQDLEKDAVKVMKSERDITATYPLPLFRFEEKQKVDVVEWCKNVITSAAEIMKEESATYTPLINYIKIPEEKDISYMIDLTINRNKELYSSSPKEMEIELVSCFYDKKVRTFLKIPEDELINKSQRPEYFEKVSNIRSSFKQFFEALKEDLNLKNTGINKDIDFYIEDSSGPEDLGVGISIFMKYKKPIDYANQKRGKESYGPIFELFDDEFKQSIEEQNSINLFTNSTEAIADGMSENSDDSATSDGEEEPEDELNTDDDSGDGEDDDTDFGDDSGDDGEMGDDMGEDGGSDAGEDDSSSDSDENSDIPKPPKQAGSNPFADINSRERITNELQELKSEVDKALVKLGPFKQSVLVGKMQELSGFIEDALKNTYIVKVEDSLIRYNLYVTQFEDLVKALKRSFERQQLQKKKDQ